MNLRRLVRLVPAVLLVLLYIAFLFTILAPDYFGFLLDKPAVNIWYYIPPFFTALYFSYRNLPEKSVIKYFLKTLLFSLAVVIIATGLLVPLSLQFNVSRCQATGICVHGEPYEAMSTIFLIIFSLYSVVRTVIFTIVFGIAFQLIRKLRKVKRMS